MNKKLNLLVVIDMQHDFVDGALSNPSAAAIVSPIAEYVREFDGAVIATRDTHFNQSNIGALSTNRLYSNMMESCLPEHCIRGTHGHAIMDEIQDAIVAKPQYDIIDKLTFGYTGWVNRIFNKFLGLDTNVEARPDTISDIADQFIESITLVGTCTDIYVVSNALILRAFFPNVKIRVIGSLCAGVTPNTHNSALDVLNSCLIEVVH